jgi:hypothetical protein
MQLSVDFHLTLWAAMARETERVGFYTQQPWYLPSRIQESELDRPQAATESDWDMAERVGRVVVNISKRDFKMSQVVRLYYGAYPGGEHRTSAERIRFLKSEVGVSEKEMRSQLMSAKKIIEGAILYAA